LTLNRPDRRNALTPALLDELSAALDAVDADPNVRAVVLTGAGKGFCAGQDLDALPADGDVAELLRHHYAPVILRLVRLSKPVIAAVNGVAAGAGASLALACDLRIFADDGALLLAFINIGLVPDAGATFLLARHVGYGRAFELAVTGERLDAARAAAWGLANRVVPAADLAAAAESWAADLAQRPTAAIELTKQLLHAALTDNLEGMLALEANAQATAAATADHAEGVAAFRAKRAPNFQGR
jgi:2-(1,2-epoxy-1,2-dihydrophenyl)acetyl-CoA isomerase